MGAYVVLIYSLQAAAVTKRSKSVFMLESQMFVRRLGFLGTLLPTEAAPRNILLLLVMTKSRESGDRANQCFFPP